MKPLFRNRLNAALLAIALIGLVTGLGLMLAGRHAFAQIAWSAGVVPVLAALIAEIVRGLSRGEVGLDIVAALSMSSALVFGESLAAAVVAVMYSGGTYLERLCRGARQARDEALCCHGCRERQRGTVTACWRTFRSTPSRPAT